jgi:hypothetical protein
MLAELAVMMALNLKKNQYLNTLLIKILGIFKQWSGS